MIKTGITRTVFLTKTKAYKFPNTRYSIEYFLRGWIANIQEKKTWTLFNSPGIEDVSVADRLCPVLKSYLWGFIIVMPRCTPCTKEEFPTENPYLEQNPWGDYKIDNYGMLNGKLVCLDYAQ